MSANRKVDASEFMFLVQLIVSVLHQMDDGVSVTHYEFRLPRPELDIEFELRVVKLNGHPVPRSTDSAVSRERKVRR